MPEQVTILSEAHLPIVVAPGVTQYFVAITYAARDQFPRTVYIDPRQDTPEERIRVISKDLAQARGEERPSIQLP